MLSGERASFDDTWISAPGIAFGAFLHTLLLARELTILQQAEGKRLDDLHRTASGMTWLLYKSLLPKIVTRGDAGPSP